MGKKKKLPEVLTFSQVDDLMNVEGFQSLKKAQAYAKKVKGQLYTQVDSGMDREYVRGNELVNRTGEWIVIKPTSAEKKKLSKLM